jgi:hypothetical protein
MPYSDFDRGTQALLHEAFKVAWAACGDTSAWSPERRAATIVRVTNQLLVAADKGERDRERLVAAGLDGA